MDNEKNADQSRELGDEEMEQVAGGLPDYHRVEWAVYGSEKKTRRCSQCGKEFTNAPGLTWVYDPTYSQYYFCSGACYEEFLKQGER